MIRGAAPRYDEATQRAWLRLARLPSGGGAVRRLLESYGSPLAAIDAGPSQWRAQGLSEAACAALAAPDEAALDADLAWLSGPDHHLLPCTDPRYPQRLLEIGQPPTVLFGLGEVDVLLRPQLAVVGARSATAQGLLDAEDFAGTLARRGLVVTSGLALGIDAAAHRGALGAGGYTIAVCGTGLDRVYPSRHRALAHDIAGQGLLVSEFAPGTPPRSEHFPRRNRIIAGLALGVLVVEAARESGSLITARLAAEQGREVFAMPGSIHNPLARGCHRLIRQGAKLVETVDDILEELAGAVGAWLREQQAPTPEPRARMDATEDALLAAFGATPMEVDQLVEHSGLDTGQVLARLLQLELAGAVCARADGRYERLWREGAASGGSRS